MSDFLSALSQKESTNNLGAINSFGYLGMWQMGEAALIDAGFIQNDGMYDNNYEVYAWTDYARSNGVSSYGEFLNSFSAQHIAVQIYHSKLEEAMRKNGAWSYIGQDISGVKITVTGLLAAAHLVGATAVKNWLRNGIVAGDANGVTSQDYANLFKSMHFSRNKEITDNHGKSIYYTEFNPEGTQTRKHNTWISSDGITKYSENRDSSDKLLNYDLTRKNSLGGLTTNYREYDPNGPTDNSGRGPLTSSVDTTTDKEGNKWVETKSDISEGSTLKYSNSDGTYAYEEKGTRTVSG